MPVYKWHDIYKSVLKAQFNFAAAAYNTNAAIIKGLQHVSAFPEANRQMASHIEASAGLMERIAKDYTKPEFDLPETKIGGETVKVTEEILDEKPYCDLVRFKRDTDRNDPKVLIVAPMSGHFATLLRGTVEALLPEHDVYITDWKDARDVSIKDGEFGLEDYIAYVQDYIRKLGPDVHVMAVCQPTVPVLAAIADMAATNDPAQPLSMTMMGGPIDTRAAETDVTKFGKSKPMEWFEKNLIMTVPDWYKGKGQKVYPGFIQLTGFMAMNPDRHMKSHMDLFNHLREGDGEKADKIKKFYDEYLAVQDLPARFYLDTVYHVFQNQSLAKGELTFQGRKIDPSQIKKTALLTIEGEKDDIAAPGQTIAAHDLCAGLPPEMKFNYLQDGAGHYGTFNGRRWREQIRPRVAGFIRETAAQQGIEYFSIPENDTRQGLQIISPEKWKKDQNSALPNPKSESKYTQNQKYIGPVNRKD